MRGGGCLLCVKVADSEFATLMELVQLPQAKRHLMFSF